jgi:hypothetical protein
MTEFNYLVIALLLFNLGITVHMEWTVARLSICVKNIQKSRSGKNKNKEVNNEQNTTSS